MRNKESTLPGLNERPGLEATPLDLPLIRVLNCCSNRGSAVAKICVITVVTIQLMNVLSKLWFSC